MRAWSYKRLGLLAVLAGVVLLGVSAAPAGAIIVRTANGKYLSYAAMSGAKTPKAQRIFDAALTNLDYSGGPVMPSNTDYVLVWNPSNYGSHTPFQGNNAYPLNFLGGVARYFSDLAADSGHSSNSDAVSTQYNDANGNTAAYNSHFGGTLTDTDPLPASGCPKAAFPNDICITDAQLQTEINSFLSAHGLPADLSHEYFVVTPPDVASCFDSGGSQCSANAVQNQFYCAYHSASSPNGYIYSNIPDLAGVFGCDPFVTFCPNFNCFYNNGPADGVLSAISHEHNESITDPQPNNAWTDWGSNVGGENGDKCNNDGMNDPNLVTQNDGHGNDTPYNEVMSNTHYLLQREWSNQTTQCLDSFTANGTAVSASFTSSPAGGNTVSFNASGSTGAFYYVWQFNDGPGQTTTQETIFPTISHTFPNSGPFTVGFTVMALDGTSKGAAHSVFVNPQPLSASFGSSAPALENTSVSFNGTTSVDPNSGATVSYSWNFGDGGTGTGGAPTHVYTAPGNYTVTLTITDQYGLSANTSHTVSIFDETPTASFSSTPAHVGSATIFTANGSDPDGAIVRYQWNFGDGKSGSGAAPSHKYKHTGTYTVTLTVTGSAGETFSISHKVKVGKPACVVLDLKGLTPSQAKSLIRAEDCRVGKVNKPKKPHHSPGSGKHWAELVVGQSPRAGKIEKVGAAVNLTLAWKAV
jgi:PKD repeat protein